MKKMKFIAAAALFLSAVSANAGVLKNGYIMCRSEEALSEGINLVISNKSEMLRGVGCWPTVSKFDGAVTNRGFMRSKVVLQMPTGEVVTVWVPSEAIAN